nr:immunoglobulin light chain junction region [Macaca mulatta]MOW08382.1 immunoglobulin light chain junction region [Macaca mulatta]MOW09234.1 immunoglobulin light chain junction region [Macaca mulatta]MOW09451.1 immunoglobulin light chain junction region [Macaca mulatta]MOW10109.1 immunoglobulin light chain junction region [Macaca mulatta]
CQHGHSIPFTF